jgi:hypothetical protein
VGEVASSNLVVPTIYFSNIWIPLDIVAGIGVPEYLKWALRNVVTRVLSGLEHGGGWPGACNLFHRKTGEGAEGA